MSESSNDPLKEKFRPEEDPQVKKEVDAALAGVDVEQLLGGDQAAAARAVADGSSRERRGKVVGIGADDVIIDLGEKAQGIAPLSQFDQVRIGEEMDFILDRFDEAEGLWILTRKGAVSQNVTWETLEPGQIVECEATAMNKGGLEVKVKTLRGFLPSGQVDVVYLKDISIFLGQRFKVQVMQVDREKKNLIVSRKKIVEREREELRAKLLAELAEGQVRRGVIRSVTDYGAFVDLGGADGLIHVSEMSHRRIRHPSEVVKIDDIVEVKVLKIDPETRKISLSLKAVGADPWADAAARYAPGTEVTARVAKIESFGAFLSVEDGIDGLLPVSEISWQRIRHPADVLKEGETIKVVSIAVEPQQRKLTFSLRQAVPDPWGVVADKYPRGTVTTGKVTKVLDFGAFVELENGVEGLVHISELAARHVKNPAEAVQAGQQVKVRVLEVDREKRRISLSIRRSEEPKPPEPPSPEELKRREEEAKRLARKKEQRSKLRGGLDF